MKNLKKRLLIYRWGSQSEPALRGAFERLGWECLELARQMKDYHADSGFAAEMIQVIHNQGIEMVFSYDYFPLIAMVCEINKLPYISWIYDCPQYTLLSKTLSSPYNHIFCFDRIYAKRLREMGAVHCHHYPLAADGQMVERALQKHSVSPGRYQCEISFIGNLYNDKKNHFRQTALTPYAAGYAEGLIRAQTLIYGYNFLRDALLECPGVYREIVDTYQLSLGESYLQDDVQLAADALGMEVSAREREQVICKLGERYPVHLYTGSILPEDAQEDNIKVMGYADYERELPLIYRDSRINLNITSKTIVSGIPKRVFDILNCGGFCLTNYQPEIAELFVDGRELVMYTDMDDLLEKVEYYLAHEEERVRIAEAGYQKVISQYLLENRLSEMIQITKFT